MANYTRISTNTTTNIYANNQGYNQCKLKTVVINKAGATANTATIYDGDATNGTTVAVIDTTTARTLDYRDVTLSRGLTVVTATGTAADLTVVWE